MTSVMASGKAPTSGKGLVGEFSGKGVARKKDLASR